MAEVLPGSRLIKDQDLRIHNQDRCDRDALLLPEAERRDRPVPHRVEAADRQNTVDPLCDLLLRYAAHCQSQSDFL